MLLLFLIFSQYDPLEWIEYRDYRYVQSIDADIQWVWVASTDGLLRFDKLRERWEIPRSKSIFPDNIRLIAVDTHSDYIWLVTPLYLSKYHPTLRELRNYSLPASSQSLQIAFTDESVYIRIGNKYYRFDRLNEEFEETKAMEDLDWKPKNRPQDFTQLSPYFVQDKQLRIYHMTCVLQDERYLWFGTEGMGIYRHDVYTFENEQITFGVPKGRILAVYTDDNRVWIGGDNNFLTLWDRKENRWKYFDLSDWGIYTNGIHGIEICQNSVWLATGEGLIRYHNNEFDMLTVFDGLPSNNITSIKSDTGELWVGTDWGLARVINGKVIKEDLVDEVIINDLDVVNDSLLIATHYGVLVRYRDEISSLPDTTGILGTGVTVMAGRELFATKMGIMTKKGRLLTYPTDIPDSHIYSIEIGSDAIWIGTLKGAVWFDKTFSRREMFDTYNSPIKGGVYKISILEKAILFGTERGLVEYEGSLQ